MNERYEIVQLINKDQVGGVYLAEDMTLERKVAFRNFERIAGEPMLSEPNDEFADFSGKLTALQHPNLLTIFDIAFDDGEAYMVTQHLEDESLADRLEDGPLPQDRVYKMAGDVLEALHAAHKSGIFHGALNTQSIRRVPKVSGGHRYMVVDMGLNHLASVIRGAADGIVDPVLMAPELHEEGHEADARADLFMLAQLCYTALAGGHPFADKSVDECTELYRADGLPPIGDFVSGVQEDFMDWIRHLAKGDPEQRPASVEEAMQLLHAIHLPEPEPPAPVARLATPSAPASAAAPAPAAATIAAAPVTAQQTATPAVGSGMEVSPASKLPLVIIVILVALIGGVIWYVMQPKETEESIITSSSSGLPIVPKGVLIHMHSSDPIDSEPVDLKTVGLLDWSVTMGVPVSSSRERKEGGKYISNILQAGTFDEVDDKVAMLTFKAGDKTISSKGVTNNTSKAEAGEGWEVYLRIPKKHKGPLLVSYYVIHQGCGVDISATAPKEESPIKFSVDSNGSGRSKILLEIPDPVPSGFYTFKILAGTTDSGEAFTFGLSGIQVSEK